MERDSKRIAEILVGLSDINLIGLKRTPVSHFAFTLSLVLADRYARVVKVESTKMG